MIETKPNPEHPDPRAQSDTHQAPPKKRSHRNWFWNILIALLAVGALLFFRHMAGRKKPVQPTAAIPVNTVTVTNGNIGVYVTALGSVVPVYTVTITSQVTGQLIRVNYREGQLVTNNDLLAEINPEPFQAQLTAAEGQLERDEALLSQARMDLERYQAAYSNRAIPKQQLDDQLHLVQQDEGTVKFDQGQVASAKVQLAFCRISSPISGRVGLRLVDPGNVVLSTSTNGLLVIAQLQPITIIFSISEDYLPQIQQQLRLRHRMTVEAYDRTQQTKIATGEFLTLNNLIDSATGTVRVRAVFTNEDNALFPNQFINAKLLITTEQGVLLIPNQVIQRNTQGTFVYLVKSNQTASIQTIKTGVTDGNVTAVEGLQRGDLIAADNFNRLQDGAKITIQKPAGTNDRKGAP
jgi:membrane fusion protein, multidrug efflux system